VNLLKEVIDVLFNAIVLGCRVKNAIKFITRLKVQIPKNTILLL